MKICLGSASIRCAAILWLWTLPLSAQNPSSSAAPIDLQARRRAAERAQDRLQEAWKSFGEQNARGDFKPNEWALQLQPKILSFDDLKTLFQEKSAPFEPPPEIRSQNGALTATLTISKIHAKIGDDPVYLRAYNGRLVGPTLRCKPGDTLYITLDNRLEPEAYSPGAMNTLHRFNTTNLHTHGLHVSPSGNSDNVLLEVNPGSTQKYVIEIPKNHPCGTFWYHAHLHGSTAGQVGSGMAGPLIIEGDMDAVPEIAAAPERILMLQQIPYVNNQSKAACPAILPGEDLKEGVVEPEYADCSFGPRTWDHLERFTTVNGVKLPVLKIRPGAIERWRIIDSGLRENILPELVRHQNSATAAPARLPMYEIAVDGLPLGRVAERQRLDLWPGYRSDVLIQAPLVPGAQYMLRDARAPRNGDTLSEERRYLALLVVEGEPNPMNLPTDAQLTGFRLPSINPDSVTARQVAAYGIVSKSDGGIKFTIDRTSYGTDDARRIQLGEVQEWTLTSRNNVGAVSHPFHIHVNPFEVFSVLNLQGEEQLDRDPKTGRVLPVWRDTVVLNEGWKVSCRMRFTDFDGVFVDHCHILDHEDQGMMELIEIIKPPPASPPTNPAQSLFGTSFRSYPARDWALPDADGQPHRLSTLPQRPVLLVFFEGFGCLRCNAQIQSMTQRYPDFRQAGLEIVGISSDSPERLRAALAAAPAPFPILADPEMNVFRAYGCYSEGPLHGIFLVDSSSEVRWQTVSQTPFTDMNRLLAECAASAPGTPPGPRAQPVAIDSPSSSATGLIPKP